MSTQYYTPQQQDDPQHYSPQQYSSQQDSGQDHGPQHDGPSRTRIWLVVLGTALAGALIALGVSLSHGSSSTPAANPTPAATSSANPATPSSPNAGGTTGGGTGGHTVAPSASVQKLQQELGQLNYYEGPVDGYMGPQTVAAVKDLQRDAHLPQTGVMNAATQSALANFLAHGNNQMAG
jgi:peptidoglycan hydrolase-like protein with peptidoglycan-binding domain